MQTTLQPHRENARRVLAEVPAEERDPARHEEPELAALGLFSPLRQALVYERVYEEAVAPRLRRLSLL